MKSDSRLVSRLVGFYEYYHALRLFDALLKKATAGDLKTIEEIIQDREELAIYTNLSRRVQRGTSTVAERPGKPQDDFKRHSFAWVIALARVELGAMLAGFTRTKRPFESIPPSRMELSAYKELMLDGLRMHYWALAADPKRKTATDGDLLIYETLTYSRRLFVARRFHQAVKKLGKSSFNNAQQAELKSWGKNLQELHVMIDLRVQEAIQRMTEEELVTHGAQNHYHALGNIDDHNH